VAVGILAWSAGQRAAAQGYLPPRPGGIGPITNPVYSPYLNLLRPGGSLTQNYFGLVRPEFDLRNAAGNLQQQVYQNDQYLNSLAYGNGTGYAPMVTGHAATFLNLQGRFLTNRPGPMGGIGNRGGGVGTRGLNGYGAPGYINPGVSGTSGFSPGGYGPMTTNNFGPGAFGGPGYGMGLGNPTGFPTPSAPGYPR
jgi:hypothetical protein